MGRRHRAANLVGALARQRLPLVEVMIAVRPWSLPVMASTAL
jgi:hypothetical protein